jgi:hypothetical protein
VELEQAFERLEEARAQKLDALLVLSGGETWFAAETAKEDEPRGRADLLEALRDLESVGVLHSRDATS